MRRSSRSSPEIAIGLTGSRSCSSSASWDSGSRCEAWPSALQCWWSLRSSAVRHWRSPRRTGVEEVTLPSCRATRREREPPSDAEIERGLRERAVNSARDAEVLLRWRQTVRPPETTPGVDLDSLSERQLERLYAGLVRLASMDETTLAALVERLLAEEEPGSN